MVTASLQPGASTIVYGALGGPVLQMNILDVFLGKSLKVSCCVLQYHQTCMQFTQAYRNARPLSIDYPLHHCLVGLMAWAPFACDCCKADSSVCDAQPFILRQWLGGMDEERRETVLGETMSLLQQKIIQPYTGKKHYL